MKCQEVPQDYTYYQLPSPWLQVKCMRVLQVHVACACCMVHVHAHGLRDAPARAADPDHLALCGDGAHLLLDLQGARTQGNVSVSAVVSVRK